MTFHERIASYIPNVSKFHFRDCIYRIDRRFMHSMINLGKTALVCKDPILNSKQRVKSLLHTDNSDYMYHDLYFKCLQLRSPDGCE